MTIAQDRPRIPDDAPKSFLQHLEDLRKALLWSAVALMIGMACAVPLIPPIIRIFQAPLERAGIEDPGRFLKVFEIMGGFELAMRVAFWSGLVMAFPFIACALGWFIFPALRMKERRMLGWVAGGSAVLFASGVATGYFLILPMAFRWLLGLYGWLGIALEFVQINDYIGFVGQVLVCLGIAFEVPLVLLVLGWLGIVRSMQLRAKRRHVIVVLMIVAMVLTPGPDPFSMLAVAVPMVILYEICIWVIWGLERRARRPEVTDGN